MATPRASLERVALPALLAALLAGCGDGGEPGGPARGLRLTLDHPPGKFVTCGSQIPLTVVARTETGTPVANLAVRFHVESGEGDLTAPAAVTDAAGVAAVTWTLASRANVVGVVSVAATDPATSTDSTYLTPAVTTASRIAFASRLDGNLDLYAVDPDGGGRLRLTTDPADDLDPAWSPDGTRLAFTSMRDGNAEVYLATAAGADPVDLTGNPAGDAGPRWSHDGLRIAFTRTVTPLNPHVYAMAASGADQVDLTGDAGGDDPAWSPDDTRLSFTSERGGGPEVWVMGADGSQPVQLSHHLSPSVRQCCAAWSPDGSVVAFIWMFTIPTAIHRNTADGLHEEPLVTASYIRRFAWSPGGDRIAFSGDSIQLVTVGDGLVTPVTDAPAQEVVWSPDGGSLAFTGEPGTGGVYLVRADGSGLVQLASDTAVSGLAWSGCTR
jgi:dipeptidyl aminopeptidase/acylaminoacyl peptidase